jgi:chaperonin GroEL
MRKQTLYGKEARDKIFEGVKKIAAAVKVTLGPMGRNVLISQSMVVDYGVHAMPLYSTKDGYRTTRGFDLMNHLKEPE